MIEKVCRKKTANLVLLSKIFWYFIWWTEFRSRLKVFLSVFPIAIETFLELYESFPSSHSPDAPVCTTEKIVVVGAYRSENLNVLCAVYADPPPRSFKWRFNSSGESFEIPKEQHFKNGTHSSVLHYTPIMDQDYGQLNKKNMNSDFQVFLQPNFRNVDLCWPQWSRRSSHSLCVSSNFGR